VHKCPTSLKIIGSRAFYRCEQLRNVELFEGLVDIEYAFEQCTSLEHITLPSTLRCIGYGAFEGCTNLITVGLPEGLSLDNMRVFKGCASLERVVIPSTVNEIGIEAFMDCSNLISVTFCEEIERLISGVWPRDWWTVESDVYVHAYALFRQWNTAERPGRLNATKWRSNIQSMLNIIPIMARYQLHYYFKLIDSKFIVYERLTNVATLLELALWKSMMSRQECGQVLTSNENLSDMRLQHQNNCGAPVIIPNILSFLRMIPRIRKTTRIMKTTRMVIITSMRTATMREITNCINYMHLYSRSLR